MHVWKPTVDAQQSREALCANNTSEFVLQTDALPSNLTDLWHFRLGHLSFQEMQKLSSRATGISFSGPLSFCEPCVHAKMKAIPFQNQGQ